MLAAAESSCCAASLPSQPRMFFRGENAQRKIVPQKGYFHSTLLTEEANNDNNSYKSMF